MIAPLLFPQLALVDMVAMSVGPLAELMVILVERIQPLASLTLILCDPEDRFEKDVEEVKADSSTE